MQWRAAEQIQTKMHVSKHIEEETRRAGCQATVQAGHCRQLH